MFRCEEIYFVNNLQTMGEIYNLADVMMRIQIKEEEKNRKRIDYLCKLNFVSTAYLIADNQLCTNQVYITASSNQERDVLSPDGK